MSIVLVILGFILLVIGGEFLVRSSVALSFKFNISKMVIGMTVVSFATSVPELIVSLQAALTGSPAIAINNVIGSNIANIGLVLGLTLAVVLGYLIYNRAIKLNLSKFFTITGIALIVVAAGVLSYGVHEFQELGWIPGDGSYAWDISSFMAKDSIAGSVLAGTIGFDVDTSWIQLFVWAAYLSIVLRLYTKPAKVKTLV